MGMTQISFRDFFQEKFFQVDRKYVDISMPRDMLAEMAIPLDIAKKPVKLDQDDINFLQQFPSQYWSQALHQRYSHDLKEALKELKARRDPVEEKLRAALKKALLTGEYGSLQNQISDELFYSLQNKQYAHVKGDEQLSEKAATKLAELETEKKIPHVDYPPQEDGLAAGFRNYKFRTSRRGAEEIEIAAKPYINRLYHKLYRTREQEHHPESGLKDMGITHGQYGYDLYGIQEGDDIHPHSTRGMQLPMRDEVSTRMSDFLNHNAHSMYGDLPSGGADIVWKPVGHGRTMYKDNWAWKKIYNKLFSQWVMKLSTAEPGSYTMPDGTKVPPEKGFKIQSQLRAAAHKLAYNDVVEQAEHGTLNGPPIPGVAPNGLPVKVKVGPGGKKVLDAPPLYLPHKKMPVRVRTPHGYSTEMHEVPLVNPSQYLRQVGTEEGDDSLDASSLRGYAKDYVHVPHEDYKKAPGYLAGGALHVTHNSSGRQHMDPSDPEYQERKEEIEQEMGMTGLDDRNQPTSKGDAQSGQFFYDIIKGIWNCINSACGGMTNHEVEIMRQSVPDLHQMVYQKLMLNLRDPRMDTARGRRAFAKNVASSWAQQDLGSGGGTRRLRRLSDEARQASLDATTQSNSGGSLSLRDSIQMDIKEKDAGDTSKLKQGEKKRAAGHHEFSYHIDNLRSIIASMEQEAEKVDNDRDEAIKLSRQDISDQIAELIGDAITDRAALVFQLQYYLTQLFRSIGYNENEAENKAQQKIEEYTVGGKAKAKQIIASFKNDQWVQQILNQPEGEGEGLTLSAQDALQRVRGILQQLPPEKLKDPATQQMIYQYIQDNVDVKDQPVVRAEADKAFGKAPAVQPQQQKPAAAAAAATVNTQTQQEQQVNAMIGAKNWLGVAKHPYFLHVANPKMLTALIGKLETAAQALAQGSLDREDHEFAVAHLRGLLKKRQVTPGIAEIE